MIQTATVDLIYQAIAHETRREIITFLREGPRAASEIAARFSVSQAAVSQHLRILLKASLLKVETNGRKRLYTSNPSALEVVRGWISRAVAGQVRSLILMPPRAAKQEISVGWIASDSAEQ